jgi:DNA end-binding protein Ku
MQSLWAGPIVCGQVSIPVRLYPATGQRDVAFRQVHRKDGGRVSFRRVCEECGRDVPYADVAKGSERPDGEIVMLSDEDLASLPRERARRIDVLSFTAAGQIDAILAGRSYYLAPDAPGTRAYLVFRDALARAGKVAVATVTLRQREAMAVLRARDRVLVLQTLLWPDEIRTADFPLPPDSAGPDGPAGPELATAAALIDTMTADFAPAGHGDRYRTELAGLVGAKAAGPSRECS